MDYLIFSMESYKRECLSGWIDNLSDLPDNLSKHQDFTCVCNNNGSALCIQNKCKKCCSEPSCTRHAKKRVSI